MTSSPPGTVSDDGWAEFERQHREDGETLVAGPDLLAAARRAHTLLVNIEVDAGEYYRETAWLATAIEAEEARRAAQPADRDAVIALLEQERQGYENLTHSSDQFCRAINTAKEAALHDAIEAIHSLSSLSGKG